ncbi:hypothetical protein CEXT_73681 [Caerostris extrusa]|uniref:Uncharacterized protein n=1 Tax=Caerostris extrusa TaxID=172846 RepID=A0AAV4M8E6_CAEEX|nr:hypothetical protein CEXT_73681 [Caerostris extrusa]
MKHLLSFSKHRQVEAKPNKCFGFLGRKDVSYISSNWRLELSPYIIRHEQIKICTQRTEHEAGRRRCSDEAKYYSSLAKLVYERIFEDREFS